MPPLLGFDDQIIFAVIDEHKLLSDKQHAFRKWHSCETRLTMVRALTRILKTGVQDSHLAKGRSPTYWKNWESYSKKVGVPPICAYRISFPF